MAESRCKVDAAVHVGMHGRPLVVCGGYVRDIVCCSPALD